MQPVLMLGWPGGWEWMVILVIALLIFGPRLPQVMRSMGKSLNEFKKGMREVEDDVDKDVTRAPQKDKGEQNELKG